MTRPGRVTLRAVHLRAVALARESSERVWDRGRETGLIWIDGPWTRTFQLFDYGDDVVRLAIDTHTIRYPRRSVLARPDLDGAEITIAIDEAFDVLPWAIRLRRATQGTVVPGISAADWGYCQSDAAKAAIPPAAPPSPRR